MITVCVPTLNRYDLLNKLINSFEAGIVKPDRYLVVDNGGKFNFFGSNMKVELHVPSHNIGVAASWNWLIKNSEEIRIICNDDIEVLPNTLQVIEECYTDKRILYPQSSDTSSIYSFFIISDYIYNLVGEFDETISPNYGYFEDNDYAFRIEKLIREGVDIQYLALPCVYNHSKSSTIKVLNKKELTDHHNKFNIAKENFRKKWGRLP